jgi:hypothetical protein
MHGARSLEETVPGGYHVGEASGVGRVPEGNRSGNDLDEDWAGVGVPAGGVTWLKVDAGGDDV